MPTTTKALTGRKAYLDGARTLTSGEGKPLGGSLRGESRVPGRALSSCGDTNDGHRDSAHRVRWCSLRKSTMERSSYGRSNY